MEIKRDGMAFVGRVTNIEAIPNADKIQRTEVVCGAGGKWVGVTTKNTNVNDKVIVFLPDAIVPQCESLAFMDRYHWRVTPVRLRGCPSEVLIVKTDDFDITDDVGVDVTEKLGVLKYEKEIPASMSGIIKGAFPAFVPKTDEPNFQAAQELVDTLRGKRFYATTKYDGTSCTVFWKDSRFGVCSRNWELEDGEQVVSWKIVRKYDLQRKLAELERNIAVQFECVGPGIQGNILNLTEHDIRVFNVFDIDRQVYLDGSAAAGIAINLGLPFVEVVKFDIFDYTDDQLRQMAEGVYTESGKQREGIVIRPTKEMLVDNKRCSFKVLNLLYKENK
jgi:RNA ligase (TIGR02306 family)